MMNRHFAHGTEQSYMTTPCTEAAFSAREECASAMNVYFAEDTTFAVSFFVSAIILAGVLLSLILALVLIPVVLLGDVVILEIGKQIHTGTAESMTECRVA